MSLAHASHLMPTEPEPILSTTNLTRRFRSGDRAITVLDDVSLSIARGEFVAIMGKSGSGKSTLLALLAGLDRPTAGDVRIDGESIGPMDEHALALLRRRKVGFVFQSFQLLSNFTAIENVMLPLELLGDRAARAKAADLLDRVGLGERGHHFPSQLSGGEQQRVALARAVVNNPAIILADEPTGNLDTENSKIVLDMFKELNERLNQTIIMITHNPEAAENCNRTIQMRDGRVESL